MNDVDERDCLMAAEQDFGGGGLEVYWPLAYYLQYWLNTDATDGYRTVMVMHCKKELMAVV